MKFKLTLLLILLISGFAQAQIRKIPAAVTEAFKARYPHVDLKKVGMQIGKRLM